MVPPDFPPLSATEVRRAISRVPSLAAGAGGAQVVWHSPRPFSATAIVSLDARGSPQHGREPDPRFVPDKGPVGGSGKQRAASVIRRATLTMPGCRFVVVKRHPASARDTVSLEAEHAFMRHLAGYGVPVPKVLDDGASSAWEERGFVYEVLQLLPGKDLYADAPSWAPYLSEAHAVSAGVALAHVHLASSGYLQPARPASPLWASARIVCSQHPLDETERLAAVLPGLGKYLAARPAWRRELGEALAPLHSAFAPHAGELSPLWAHNDWHPSNLLWSAGQQSAGLSTDGGPEESASSSEDDVLGEQAGAGAGLGADGGPGEGADVAGIIDFSLANLTSAAYDLATALERSVVSWLSPPARWRARLAHAGALLRGYASVRPLDPGEAVALPHLLPLVHVDYALSEVDYYVRVARSPANADVAWETYLLGHLRWWASPAGQRLVSYVADMLGRLEAPQRPGATLPSQAPPASRSAGR